MQLSMKEIVNKKNTKKNVIRDMKRKQNLKKNEERIKNCVLRSIATMKIHPFHHHSAEIVKKSQTAGRKQSESREHRQVIVIMKEKSKNLRK